MAKKRTHEETIFDITAVWDGDRLNHTRTKISTLPEAPQLLVEGIRNLLDQENFPVDGRALIVMGFLHELLDMFGREKLEKMIDAVIELSKQYDEACHDHIYGDNDDVSRPDEGPSHIIPIPFNPKGPKS